MDRFRATYDGNGVCTLHCPRCNTRESGSRLDRIEDHARIHSNWWHGEPIRLPWQERGLSIIDVKEGRRLR